MSPLAPSCLQYPLHQAFPVPAAATLLAVIQNGAKCSHCVCGPAGGTGYCGSPHELLQGVLVCGMSGFVARLGGVHPHWGYWYLPQHPFGALKTVNSLGGG